MLMESAKAQRQNSDRPALTLFAVRTIDLTFAAEIAGICAGRGAGKVIEFFIRTLVIVSKAKKNGRHIRC